ncbi:MULTISPECIES: AbrB/MazE/SpoVT family DNA-binding domain-containing protein [Halomonadaceae]|uniref:SpoVT-AbrB domain-containing protein n=1 Tax=Modicisalibacter zincidurans TaxID=1178777 RepID=A0ABP9R9D5_9GAMM|nr:MULTISPECIES: AbrB/MazE/SpoVT family DNA-binding domain-containing protein [Halomonas]MCD6008510.1 AbrB/MazE/SpoVT family DNA-binding domain-containing protein [Halomonas sp. IOP_31]MEA3252966.1 AbrB/MazE/SpoVT family DNA-binding domain-containing protein [Pseudomonadota bacterium]
MRTTLRKIGNSRGVLIPALLLDECGIDGEIELHQENGRIVIEPIKPARQGWFDDYQEQRDTDAWQGLPPDTDSDDWEW